MSLTKTAISKKIILITGASSDFGRLTAEALARAGHTAYASMRDGGGRKASNAAEMAEISAHDGLEVRPAISTSGRSRRPMPRSRRSSARAVGRRRGP
jgi:NAD(P)-dependent dehydrogenase (short-subunit alcohol dehydrogenase family)